MCGATDDQKNVEDEQQQMYKTLNDQYKQVFGEREAITGALSSTFTPILQAGPGQHGFTNDELTSLNTGAAENTASSYRSAGQATRERLAAQGGGNEFLPSGYDAQVEGALSSDAASSLAGAKNTITQNDFATGRQNWATAASVLGGTASTLDPTGMASTATGAGSAAGNTANQIAQANNSLWQAGIGALGGVAGAYAGTL